MIYFAHQKGGSLIEIMIVVSLSAIVIGTFVAAGNSYFVFSSRNLYAIKASYLMEEGIEAVKVMRDDSYAAHVDPLSSSASYYLVFQNNTWRATTTRTVIDNKFERTFVAENAYRDGNDELGASGTLDSDARLVTVSVAWIDPISHATTTKSISTYVINIFNN